MRDRPVARDLPGLIGCLLTIGAGVAALAYSTEFSPLGSVFPRAIAGVMIALAAWYIVLTLMGRTQRAEFGPGSTVRRLGVVVVMLAWAFALSHIGFLASSIAAFVALLIIANHDRWTARSILVYGVAGAVILGLIYGLFRFALLVPLPTGLLL